MIKTIVLIVIGILIVSYFHVDIKRVVESPDTQKNFSYVTAAVGSVWNNYLKTPVMYIWNEIIVKLIVHTAKDNIKDIKASP